MSKLPDNPYALSPKRWRFVQEYLKDLNATQACIRAGYAAKRSDQQGYELLSNPEVAAVVAKEKDIMAEALECTRGDIMLELQAVAFANISDFGMWLDDGTFLVTAIEDIPRHLLGAIQRIENVNSYNKDGDLIKSQVKLFLHPKMDALKTLANIKKIDNIQPVTVVDNRQLHVKQVMDQYADALDDVAKTFKEIPTKKESTDVSDDSETVAEGH